ncbi:MAG: argininosuccinate synthase [Candidatus Margulisbacteria bacterium]|nr:argininosuccinate synthase [Candidatus Margulisiibacteriota bacterium]MBU1022470.1 argininosuccinate synthase [Candidatus Margulisiibacteriota bacterium]MBU1728454.1 argininosuccinate synthase [Candidatus Margulisiibacteriota bacterium]MBU1954601.1 argininosuccinate synthase [Candidatus Margulisiibacteriota bacterium]
MKKVKKVVLAYSGGLDTSIIIPWLKETYDCEVIAMIADLGQHEDLSAAKVKAQKTGASKVFVEDLKKEFAENYLMPMLKSGAVYEGRYYLGTAIARPLIAKRQIEIAQKEKADAVSHGATGKGNDQVRFELTFKALDPDKKIIAPWREWDIKSRTDAVAYAKARGIPVPVTAAKPYSSDRNLWHVSYEGGILEDPWKEPDESMFEMTRSPDKTPNKPVYVEIYFEKGIPQKIDGTNYAPYELISKLNKLAGAHGVGRVDMVENRLVGIKSRGVYETPAGTVLQTALTDLESITTDRDTAHYKRLIAEKYAELIYFGQWFSPLREALDGFINIVSNQVTGTVRLKLFKGNCMVVGRKAPKSLYNPDLATFEEEEIYNQKDAEGFINLFGLPLKVQAKIKKMK